MIGFTILFALGFLAALLLMLMLAPAIQKRIVAYTEKRLYATMPISPAEVRAQKDMARALYAAENARLRQELEEERQRSIELRVRHDDEQVFHRRIESNTQELRTQVVTLEKDIQDLQSHLQMKQEENATLAQRLEITEEVANKRAQEIVVLETKVKHIVRELDEVKIQLASRAVEIEREKSRASSMKAERDVMHKELGNAEAKNKDVAEKVTRESRRVSLLEQKLADKAMKDAETEILLERRANEIARLKERLRAASAQGSGKESKALSDEDAEGTKSADNNAGQNMANETMDKDAALEQIRQRSASLSQRLLQLGNQADDASLRDDLAQLAADMVSLTAIDEGQASPIYQLLKDADKNEPSDSLANRTRQVIAQQHG